MTEGPYPRCESRGLGGVAVCCQPSTVEASGSCVAQKKKRAPQAPTPVWVAVSRHFADPRSRPW